MKYLIQDTIHTSRSVSFNKTYRLFSMFYYQAHTNRSVSNN